MNTMSTLPDENQETRSCQQSLEWTPPNTDSESSPTSSEEKRKNTIYVRIKRISKREDCVSSRSYTRVHFNPSVLVPDVQLQTINHLYHHLDESRHHFGLLNLSFTKIEMIRKLLDLETGPLAWSSFSDKGTPPAAFVWYLASILSIAVENYLKQDTGKAYWIKHVSFWSDFLDPKNSWWNMGVGSSYKAIAERLHNRLHSRMVQKPFIDCNGDQKAQDLLVRACILFARKV